MEDGGNCIEVYLRVQIVKIHPHFNTSGNIFLIFPQKFERDSYFTSTTLQSTHKIHNDII